MTVNDSWHKSDIRPNDPTCREHGKPITATHGKGKRWEVRDPATGKREFFAKITDARKADQAPVQTEAPTIVATCPADILFGEFARSWFANYRADDSTKEGVASQLRVHIYPLLEMHSLKELSETENLSILQTWMTHVESKVAASTASKIHATLSSIFNSAVAHDILGKNPLRRVPKPKRDEKKIIPWPHETLIKVTRNLPPDKQIICHVGAGAGLRQAEIFALDPADIKEGTLQVLRQVVFSKEGTYFKLPKGRKTRIVPLAIQTANSIQRHVDEYGTVPVTLPWGTARGRPRTYNLLLTTGKGQPVSTSCISEPLWYPAVRAAGLPTGEYQNGMHALRHFFASYLLANGLDIVAVSNYLGHEKIATTLKYYAHLMPGHQDKMRGIMDNVFPE